MSTTSVVLPWWRLRQMHGAKRNTNEPASRQEFQTSKYKQPSPVLNCRVLNRVLLGTIMRTATIWNRPSLTNTFCSSIKERWLYSCPQSRTHSHCILNQCSSSYMIAAMAEWLRRLTRNQMGSSRVGSNPTRSELSNENPRSSGGSTFEAHYGSRNVRIGCEH